MIELIYNRFLRKYYRLLFLKGWWRSLPSCLENKNQSSCDSAFCNRACASDNWIGFLKCEGKLGIFSLFSNFIRFSASSFIGFCSSKNWPNLIRPYTKDPVTIETIKKPMVKRRLFSISPPFENILEKNPYTENGWNPKPYKNSLFMRFHKPQKHWK